MVQAHPFLSSAPRHDHTRAPNLAVIRDPVANVNLQIGLLEYGFDHGESILNFPPEKVNFDLLPEDELVHVEIPFAQEGDVLVLSTRPSLSDGDHGDNKKIEPSNTTIERAIYFHYWRYFARCSRAFVTLTEEAASFLPQGMKNRAEMTFFQQLGCHYMHLRSLDGQRSRREPMEEWTAAFLLRVDEIWPGGPGLVAAWGLNAISTLAWSAMLRDRCSSMLDRRGLTMVELHPTEAPDRPSTYDWLQSWAMRPVFHTDGELPPRPEEVGRRFRH
jgi:hypothetical protein